MTFAVFNPCSNDDHSRRLKHCQLSFFAIFATFCSRVFSGWISGSADERTKLGPREALEPVLSVGREPLAARTTEPSWLARSFDVLGARRHRVKECEDQEI